jgi:hypothetical protein
MNTLLLYWFMLTNFGIVSGYIFLGVRVVPKAAMNMTRTKVGGILFFLTCAYTHFELGLHAFFGNGLTLDDMLSWHMIVNHTIQVFAVWAFVTGLYLEFVKWGPWGNHWEKMLEDERQS